MRKLLGRFSVTIYVCIVVCVLVWASWPSRCAKVTLGTIANKQVDLTGCRLVIVNCIQGKRVGRSIIFEPPDDSRHCVILSLADAEVEPTITTFRGYCIGVFDERVPECPHDPPFLYVVDVRPIAAAD